jgi:hypothetical protein
MSFLETLRVKLFHGYEPKPLVRVDWWSGRQRADVVSVLRTENARRLLGDELPGDPCPAFREPLVRPLPSTSFARR